MKNKNETKDIRTKYEENEKIVGRWIAVAFIVIVILIAVLWRASCNNRIKETSTGQSQKRIEQCFSKWDGSHIELTKLLKSSMNDPDSYEHVETRYWSRDNEIYIITTYRGKNGFGATVKESMAAYSTLDCHIFKIEEL